MSAPLSMINARMTTATQDSGVRLAELMAALSLATDLGTGQPMEHAIRSCVLAVRLGEACGLSEEQLTDVYYLALLRFIGCTTENQVTAQVFGDELALGWSLPLVSGGAATVIRGILRNHGADEPPLRRAHRLLTTLVRLPKVTQTVPAHCEVGQRLAARMSLGAGVQHALGQVHEYWNGMGHPKGLKGEEIALPLRVVQVAFDAFAFLRVDGVDGAVAVARKRSGKGYDPQIAERFCREASRLVAGIDSEGPSKAALDAEPGPRPRLSNAELDEAIRAIADFADLKSPYTAGHSSAVAELAAAAAELCRLPRAETTMLLRAGLLHEIGQVGVSASIWNKTGPLTESEWERMRLHSYYTERILARPDALAQIGSVASLHHERLDGSGYHRGATASTLSLTARILEAACVYHTKGSPRPHRTKLSPEAVADELKRQTRAGQLDGDAVNAVLAAAGHGAWRMRRERPAGLTEREVEVLRLIAEGLTRPQMAARLSVSKKTIASHIEHIYNKIGVSTRAGATLFAMQHGLLQAPWQTVQKSVR